MFNIVELKERIKSIGELTESDRKVLSVVDSFWGSPDNYIKANLANKLVKYAGCEAWKIAMNYTYTKHMKYTYSKSLNDMVVESFYWNGRHYTWHDEDCVYYNDETDEDYWMTVPDDAY